MMKIVVAFALTFLFLGCSSKSDELQNVKPKLTVGTSINDLSLNDQFEKKHSIEADTKKIIFAFSKDVAHTCNDFFVTQTPTYLADNKIQFIADVSAAPSLIRSMFIMPGLKDFKHTVLVLDDEVQAAPFRAGVDVEKIVVVYIDNGKISEIKTISSPKELQATIEAK